MTSGTEPAAAVSTRPRARQETAVLHLVRKANGLEPFARFLDSYRSHPAGVEHELVLVFKGFAEEAECEAYVELAAGLAARSLKVPDDGYDLGAYRRAALLLEHPRLLLLNSFSVILAGRWLEFMAAAAARPGIVAVAATGSWGSRASHQRFELGLGGPYGRLFPDRATTQGVFARLAAPSPDAGQDAGPSRRGKPAMALEIARTLMREARAFSAFPSPHLRTNGLFLRREDWLRVSGVPADKLAAHRLESGRRGITELLGVRGGEVCVVGRDGHAWRQEEWPESLTFWQGDQRNLLIGDNQTIAYETGEELCKRVLSAYAWGERALAAPSAPAGRAAGKTPA